MILVDTNVWSEALRPVPDESVRSWAKANTSVLCLSTVVLGELLSGAELLPDGQRKQLLQESYRQLISQHEDRVFAFDLEASIHYATILAIQFRAGRNPGTADTQIAATAVAHKMALATRNVRHFEGLGLELIDPWTA